MTITPYVSAEFDLSIIPDDAGSFRVLAPSLARSLGFRESFDLLRTVPDAEKGSELVRTPGGEQRVGFVTEAGFYRVLGQRQAARITDLSVRGQVERFQSWVYGDVLPSIRRGTVPAKTLPRDYPSALRELAAQVEATELAKVRIRELEPAASAWSSLVEATGDYSVGDAAKMLSRDPSIQIGQNSLFRWLGKHGWLYQRGGEWHPYQDKVGADLLTLKTNRPYWDSKRGVDVLPAPTVRVTAKGLQRLYRELGGMDPMVEVSA